MDRVDIIIGGMQKCGTTFLAKYLERHDAIVSHPQTEMSYFYDAQEYHKGWSAARKKYFFLSTPSLKEKYLLAKQSTLIRKKDALVRLYKHNPEVKLLVILREPVQRAWSSFLMDVSNGHPVTYFKEAAEKLLINENVDHSDWRQNIYFDLGIYYKYLEQIYEVFPQEQVKILLLEQVEDNPAEEIRGLLKWLKLPEQGYDFNLDFKKVNSYKAPKKDFLSKTMRELFLQETSFLKRSVRKVLSPSLSYKLGKWTRKKVTQKAEPPILDPNLRTRLKAFYQPYNQKLSKNINLDLSYWNS